MSLFQCSSCGGIENTSCTNGYWNSFLLRDEKAEVMDSYRKVLGLPKGEPYGSYCSVCDPTWFTVDGNYGIGPRPENYTHKHDEGTGKWHGRFPREFLPKGMFHTDEDGNLAHVKTLDTDVDKYILPEEDTPGLHVYQDRDVRLPRPGTPEHRAYLKHGGYPPPKKPRSTAASIVGMAAAMGMGFGPRVERVASPEEIEASNKASAERVAKAEAKRLMKANKRKKV